jgi:hypothetical protein
MIFFHLTHTRDISVGADCTPGRLSSQEFHEIERTAGAIAKAD